MGSHLLGLANSSQLQYSKHFKMKLPMIIAATVAVGLAGPQHLRSFSVGTHLRGRYDGYALRRNFNTHSLRTYSNYQNYLSKTPVPFSEPYRLDGPISPGPQFTGNYVGKQLDQVAVLPAAASGLAYMRAYFDKNDLCGTSGLAYMETILSGGSGVQAQANAEAAYKAAWARGGRIVPGSACAASEVAFKEAYASGNGRATIESALAFVNTPTPPTGTPWWLSSTRPSTTGRPSLTPFVAQLPLPGSTKRLPASLTRRRAPLQLRLTLKLLLPMGERELRLASVPLKPISRPFKAFIVPNSTVPKPHSNQSCCSGALRNKASNS